MLALVLAAAIGFLAPDDGGVWQFWATGAAGTATVVAASPSDSVWVSDPAADGRMLVTRADGTALLVGPDFRELRSIPLGQGCHHASLSPDGARIAYVCAGAAGPTRDLVLLDLDPGAQPRHLRAAGLEHAPAWAADGKSIVFSAQESAGGGASIWTRAVDDTSRKQLSVGPHLDLDPVFGRDGSIYFSSNRDGDYDIYRMSPETFAVSRVVDSPGHDGSPRLSPDGARLLFVSDRAGHRQLWEANVDGRDAKPIALDHPAFRSPMFLGGSPGLEPAPGRVAYLRTDDDGRWQLWSMRADGGDQRQIARLAKDPSRISVTRDGRTLLANTSDGTIYKIELSSRSVTEVTVDPPGSTDAAISPDGTRIAYSASTLGGIDTNDIWATSIQGGIARKVTQQDYMQHFPTWTPSGEILYLSGRGGQVHDIWSVPAEGGTPRKVLGDHRYNFELTASVRGDIAFSSNRNGDYDLYRIAAGSTTAEQITRRPAYDGQASFSPDGSQLVFVSRRDGAGHLWLFDIASGASRVLTSDGDHRMPVWYPDGDADRVSSR